MTARQHQSMSPYQVMTTYESLEQVTATAQALESMSLV